MTFNLTVSGVSPGWVSPEDCNALIRDAFGLCEKRGLASVGFLGASLVCLSVAAFLYRANRPEWAEAVLMMAATWTIFAVVVG